MYDLIIVGGGPSGSAAGRVAGKAGIQTLLLEKERFPRYKPCGGALSKQALSYLDFELPEEIIERDISGIRGHYEAQSVERYGDCRFAVLVNRSVLDSFLLDRAGETGIEVHTGEKVLACEERENCVEVSTEENSYLAKFVLISEGAQGRLKDKIRKRKDGRGEYSLALVTEIPEEEGIINRRLPGLIDIHFGVTKGGYGWIFPHAGYYSAGILGTAKYLKHPKQVMRDFLQANGFSGDYQYQAHLIPTGGVKRNLVNSRLLLSGDAAGFVDAFTGEGIAYAIRSGQLAAELVARIVLYNEKLEGLKTYESNCKHEFGKYLNHSLKLEQILNCFPETSFRLATGNEEILKGYLEMVVLNRSYLNFIRWLLLNFKLR